MAEEKITDGKIKEALKFIETEQKELELRKVSLAAYINTSRSNQALAKEKAALVQDIVDLRKQHDEAKAQHVKDWNEREAEFKQKSADLETVRAKEREADQKELTGLKASISQTRKQAADVEKQAGEKIAASNKKVAEAVDRSEKVIADLDKEIQLKQDRNAALDEEFRTIMQKHGMAAAAN